MQSTYPLFYRLSCQVMDYAWGQRGRTAFISQLMPFSSFLSAFAYNEANSPAAELWMGAHPKAPALIQRNGEHKEHKRLDHELAANPSHFLGPELADQGSTSLSFLFKVLDVARPLSIQAHPDSSLAKKLHQEQPEYYPDPYAKPELAVCIRDMRALIGFRPLHEIFSFLQKMPVLADLCARGLSAQADAQKQLKKIYTALMQAPPTQTTEAAQYHLSFLKEKKAGTGLPLPIEDDLFCLFVEHYGFADPGIFCAYFLNYVELKTGESLFLEPNTLHSYIGGVILECMSASDNTVRSGLTKKHRDIPILLDMLDYCAQTPQIIKPLQGAGRVKFYPTPVSDFSLHVYGPPQPPALRAGDCLEFLLTKLDRPSILLILEGEACLRFYSHNKKQSPVKSEALVRGTVLLLPGDLQARGLTARLFMEKGAAYRALSSL